MRMPMPTPEELTVEQIAAELAEHRTELDEVEDPAVRRVLRNRIEALEAEIKRRDRVYEHAYGPKSASNALAEIQSAEY